MPITHPEFDANTEAVDVAKAFQHRIQGKTILLTGSNLKGIGFSTAQGFASQSPARIILAGRTPAKIQECFDALRAEFPAVDYRALEVDLSSQQSVRAAAAQVLSTTGPWNDVPIIDLVVNTAGVMGLPQRTLSVDGIEMHMATNHIGHWLLTCLLMPKLLAAAQGKPKGTVRIVNVTSGSPTVSGMRWSDVNFDTLNKDLPAVEQPNYEFMTRWGYSGMEDMAYVPIDGYNRSKVANVLASIGFTEALYDKYGILSVAVHPGVIKTELGRSFAPETLAAVAKLFASGAIVYKTLGAGASTSLVAALDDQLRIDAVGGPDGRSENYGAFLADCQIDGRATPQATSSAEAAKLWALSEKLVNEKFAW